MENKEGFSFTYSAEQQKEIEAIRKKYLPKEADKMEQLRKLHAIPTQKAQAASLAVGIIGALIMGTGMSCCMVWADTLLLPGIVIGLIGMAVVGAAYPLYNRVLKKERERIAPEIMRLTDELMK